MTAADVLNIGRSKAYDMARDGDFPCEVFRARNSYRVATANLLRLLALDRDLLTILQLLSGEGDIADGVRDEAA